MVKSVTSKDIAEYAGVSQATVSYVLNNVESKNISEATKERILKAVKDLNYIPNSAAQRMKKKATKCIAVRIATTLTMKRYYLILQGIRACLEPQGYSILLCGKQADDVVCPNYIRACLSGQADGIIYISSDNDDIKPEYLELIKKHGLVLSAIDCMSDNREISSINYDYFASSYRRAEIFLQNGYRKFIYLRPSYQNLKETQREKGIQAAVKAYDDTILQIIKYKFIDSNSSSISTEQIQFDPSPQLIQDFRDLVFKESIDTAYICSSREISEIIARFLHQRWLLCQEEFEGRTWQESILSYHFDHYSVGFESARSILDNISGIKTVRKLMMAPTVDLINPEYY